MKGNQLGITAHHLPTREADVVSSSKLREDLPLSLLLFIHMNSSH